MGSGALLDLIVAFVITIIGFALTNFNVLNTQNADYYTSIRTASLIKNTIDAAPVTATVTSGTGGLLDNDGATVAITGRHIYVYQGRPLNSATVTQVYTARLQSLVYLPGTTTPLVTTLFIAPNHSITMQDGWSNGTIASPASGCPHATMQVGSSTDLLIDCTTGSVSVQQL